MALLLREAIGAGLRRARTARRRTLRDVSRRARVSLGYLSEVERGRKEPSSELLAAICEALDVALPDLLTEAAQSLAGADGRRRTAPAHRPAPHGPASRGHGHRSAGCAARGHAVGSGPPRGARRRLIPAPFADPPGTVPGGYVCAVASAHPPCPDHPVASISQGRP